MAVLAKQKASLLGLHLRCLSALEYNKKRIVLWVRTNDSTDETESILRRWVAEHGDEYHSVHFDASSVDTSIGESAPHDWTPKRLRLLGKLRQESLEATPRLGCDFYFVVDCDNFVRPNTLRELVKLNLPIVGPMLPCCNAENGNYGSFHSAVDSCGYYADSPDYSPILNRSILDVHEVPVVHCTYLVRADAIPKLTYCDGTDRHEYVIFSDSARKAWVAQYIDNRYNYGCLDLSHSQSPIPAAAHMGMPLSPSELVTVKMPTLSSRPKICLTMIVRNEGKIIERCLAAARPLITSWCIVDTGSTDDTKERVLKALADLPGVLHDRPWVNFGRNRTEALALARAECDAEFALTLDADDLADVPSGWKWPALDADSYAITTKRDSQEWGRILLLRMSKPFKYTEPAHELPYCDEPTTSGWIDGLKIVSYCDGASWAEGTKKYERFAEMFARDIAENGPTLRSRFYLAQAFWDASQPEKAIVAYDDIVNDASLGNCEERWYSAFRAAKIADNAGRKGEAIRRMTDAYSLRPTRAEAPAELARMCNEIGQRHAALDWARTATMIPYDGRVLFPEKDAYEWGGHFQAAIALGHLGRHEEAIAANEKVLACRIGAQLRIRVEANMRSLRESTHG